MIAQRAEIVLWTGALALAALAGTRTRSVDAPLQSLPAHLLAVPSPVRRASPESLVVGADVLVTRDPFRLERRPSAVPYTPALEFAPPAPPRPPRPALAVTGIVGGPPWEALLEGVPGQQGSVLVRRGDTLGGLRVRSVTKDTVRITGMDTTWALAVRRAWQ